MFYIYIFLIYCISENPKWIPAACDVMEQLLNDDKRDGFLFALFLFLPSFLCFFFFFLLPNIIEFSLLASRFVIE